MSGNTTFLNGARECSGVLNGAVVVAPDSKKKSSFDGNSLKCNNRRRRIEAVVLGVVILVVWMLLSLPVIFYVVRSGRMYSSFSGEDICELYDKSACRIELETLTQCLVLDSEMVSPQNGDLDQAERHAFLLKTILQRRLEATRDCQDAAMSFSCQFLFPPCTPSGEKYLPSQEQCLNVSTDTCSGTWQELLALGAPLPDCNTLQPGSSICNITGIHNSSQPRDPTNTLNTTCREDFALVDGLCVARCDSWEQNPHGVTVAVMMVTLVSASFGLLAGITVVVISCLRWKIILTYPSVLIVYMTLAHSIVAIFVIVTFFDTPKLYCSELSVEGSLENPTLFCTIAGVVFQYFLLSISLWWFFHVSSIFWKLQFPMHARKHALKQKYIHGVLVCAGLLIPVPGTVVILATDGFTVNTFPPLLCAAKDSDAQYYSMWLVINVLIAVSISMLIIMLWTIHKHEGLFHLKERKGSTKVSMAEKKLLFVFSYYIVFAAITLVHFGVSTGERMNFIEAVREYFVCEAGGYNPEDPCPRNYEQYVHPGTSALSYLLMGFVPAVNLIFVINISELKSKFARMSKGDSSARVYSI